MAVKICGYGRISVDLNEDKDENTSIETQKKRITEYVKREFPNETFDPAKDIFVDRDRSGYTFEQREGYQKMKQAILAGRYNVIIVKDLTRFSRRVSLGAVELETLLSNGVRIIGCDDGVNLDKSIDTLSFIRLIFAEDTVTTTSKKVSNAIATRQKEGTWICNAPYGYYIRPDKKGQIFIDEEGAKTVRKIFELYNQGNGYKTISHYLTEHGYPTGRQLMVKQLNERGADTEKMLNHAPINPNWSVSSVSKILSNDFYIGTLRQGVWKRAGINKTDKRTDKKDQYVFENHHAPIIDMDTWNKAQRLLRKNTRNNYAGVTLKKNPYTGIIRCADCGSRMFAVGGKQYRAGYNCSNYLRNGIKGKGTKRRKLEYSELGCTGSHYIAEEDLNKLVKIYIGRVKERLTDSLATMDVTKSEQAAEKDRISSEELAVQKEELKNEIKANEKQRIRQILKDESREAEINRIFDELNDEAQQQIEALELKIAFLSEKATKRKELKDSYQEIIRRFDLLLDKPSFEKTDLHPIIKEITVDADKVVTIQLFSDITDLFELTTES